MKLEIEGRPVEVDDSFKTLSRADQDKTVDEIASQMKIKPGSGSESDIDNALIRAPVKAAAGGFGVGPTVAGALDQPAEAAGYKTGIDLLRSQVLPEGEKPNYRKVLDYLGFGAGPESTRQPGGSVGEEMAGVQEAAASRVAAPPVSAGGKILEAAATGGIEAIAGTGMFRAAGRLFRSYPEAAAFLQEMSAAPVAQATIGGLAAGGGELAQQEGVNPLIGAGLGMAAGIAGHGAGAGIRRGIRGIGGAVDTTLVRTPDALEEAARAQLRSRATDPDAALAALEGGAAREIVPGSRPTTVEATGDIGLGSLDREMRTVNRQAYEARAGEQNAARVAELEALKGTGTIDDALSAFDARMRNIDDTTARFEDAARAQAEATTAQGVQARSAEEVGQAVRDPMQAARNQAGIETKKLWNAVDPDGTLMVGTGPIKASVGKEFSTLSPTAKRGLSAAENSITDQIKAYGSSLSFKEFGDLRSLISSELSKIQRAVGQADPSFRRLTILKESTEDAMKKGVRRLGADDPNLFQRLASLLDEGGPRANVGEAAATAVRAGQVPGGGRGPVPRAGNQAAGGAGTATGTPRLPISEFIAKHGGLPLDAESTARDWGRTKVKGKPLAHASGRSIDDYWRQTLMEEGYLAPDDYHGPGGRMISRDVDDEIRRLIEEDLAGRGGGKKPPAGGPEEEHAANRATIEDRLKREGFQGKPDPAALDRAAAMMTDGSETHPTTAYERALMEGEETGGAQATFASLDERTRQAAKNKKGGEDFFDLAGATHEARLGAAEEMATGKGGIKLTDAKSEHKAIITKNTTDDEPWRITYVGKDGVPIGHRTFATQAEAIDDALKEGYRKPAASSTDVPLDKPAGAETHPTTAYERAVMESPEPEAQTGSSFVKEVPREQLIRELQRGMGYSEAEAAAAIDKARAHHGLTGETAPLAPSTDVPFDRPAGAAPSAASTVDEEAAGRYKAASKSTRELHRVYDKGSAGAVLRRGDTNNAGYKISDPSVATNAFKQGNEGANRIRQLREAGATNEALAEAASLSLSKFVRDGVLDPGKFRSWAKSHEAALDALPPEVRRGFQSAADAGETLARVARRRAEVLKEADASAVAKVLGVDEGDLMNKLGTYVRSTKSMRELANAVRGNPAAEAGLRRMVGQWLQSEFTGNWEKFTSGEKSLQENAFATFIGDHKAALRQVFSEADVGRFQAIYDDMARAKRTLTTGKDPAGPSTAADTVAIAARQAGMSILANLVSGGHGWAINLGRGVANALKLSGTAKVDELVRQALLDPELARRLLAPAKTIKGNPQAQNALARRLMALSWPGAVQASQQNDRGK